MGNPDENKNPKQDLQIVEAGDENPERGNWTGKLDFLLSCLGYAVGLGNVWRFPYLCYKHGGGAFLIPYALMLLVIGIPCFFLELCIGQYAALGPVTVYSNMAPMFKGMGFTNFMASCFVGLYYNMIIAWTIYYTFASFTSTLPWSDCSSDFNTENCFSITDFKACSELRANSTNEVIYLRGKCINDTLELDEIRNNLTAFYGCNESGEYKNETGIYLSTNSSCEPLDELDQLDELFDTPVGLRRSAAQEYLERSVLNESEGIEDMGPVQWHLCLCLLAAWIVIFLCLIKGIKSSGKVVYFTATFPYFVLVILLIRAVTLPGAYEGIKFYIVPDWSRLSDITVWEGAAVQIFFSLSVAGGGLITLASYNRFHNNILRDTVIVCFGNCLTSVFAGFCIFSVLGFMAKELGVEVKDVVQSGTGLAFVAYPDLVTRLPVSPLWAILFFLMLFTLGLDSQFAIVETIVTGILDFNPKLRSKKTIIVGIVCAVGFICGIPLTTRGGSYLLELLDYYAASWPYLFIGFVELIMISYVYGINNFLDDLHHIMNFRPNTYFRSYFITIYTLISPLVIIVILLYSWSNHTSLTRGEYSYPKWANDIGWAIAMIAIIAVPIGAVIQVGIKLFVEHKEESWGKRLRFTWRDLMNPTPEWRANADRARVRDGHASNGHAPNGGFDNLAMAKDEATSEHM